MSCAHYLTRTRCTNCDSSAMFSFPNPDPKFRGWFGGCGSFDCTGKLNILVHDQDGSFFGTPSVAIPNNVDFGFNNPDCK